ncbi:hypothetical protein [Oryzibacter oryziterrae]|uniref:hypothetical protein n=1 Tax=Oryzibacter oryziterrae TaxID=2766474 RepID=UPI001F2CF0F0|nr:hypothetical protein [Oryzibacter oryziterrae]
MPFDLLRRMMLVVALVVLPSAAMADVVQSQPFGPINDSFATPTDLSDDEYLTLGSLLFATRQIGEPAISATSAGRSVWYNYKPKADTRAVIALTTGNLEAAPFQIAAYTGDTPSSLKRLAAATMKGVDSETVSLVLDLTAGTTYRIKIDTAIQAGGFRPYFNIGLRRIASAGGLAMLRWRSAIIEDGTSENREVLVVNGYGKQVDVKPDVGDLADRIAVASATIKLAPKAATWFRVADQGSKAPDNTTKQGKLVVTASEVNAKASIGSSSVEISHVAVNLTDRPTLTVRFARPGQGFRTTLHFLSSADVANTSTVDASGCRFEPDEALVGTKFYRLGDNGKWVDMNRPFAIAAGTTKHFQVVTSGWMSGRAVSLRCGHRSISLNTDPMARMTGYPQLGEPATLTVTSKNVDGLLRFAMPDFATSRLTAKIVNGAGYAGEYRFAVAANSTPAGQVEAYCLSNASGVCKAATTTTPLTLNLAERETVYVTLMIHRGNATGDALVTYSALATDGIANRQAATGGFMITEQ